MKKFISIILALSLALSLSVAAFADYDNIKVLLNGTEIEFDQKPVMAEGDRVLVPVRLIAEKFGAILGYDEETETVMATVDDTIIILQIGASEMHINGETVGLDVPAQEINGRTLIPVRAFAEAFNCKVEWNEELETVTITR